MEKDISSNFQVGTIRNLEESWTQITSDRVIIDIVRNGLKVGFKRNPINNYMP